MKFLVSGLGSIGMRHAKNLIALGHEVYGYDVDDSKYGDIRKWDRKTKVDARLICSPTSDHSEDAAIAVDCGEHVFIEKPIADHVDENLRWALEAAKEANLVVMTGNNLRFRHSIQTAKGQIALIGPPFWANFILSQHSRKYTDHVILNWGAHELDLACYLLGPARVVSCVGDPWVSDIILQHENSCQTSIHLDYGGRPETREFVIVGNLGRVRCDLVAATDNDASYVAEIKTFISRIRGGEDPIGATGDDGLATLKLITTAMEMAK